MGKVAPVRRSPRALWFRGAQAALARVRRNPAISATVGCVNRWTNPAYALAITTSVQIGTIAGLVILVVGLAQTPQSGAMAFAGVIVGALEYF
jgi:hypothetical protein